ncbi:DUF3817 domain-containing protein [Microtetraspora sp. AC03309]|uniref:hypothetical protein n=1 Tax=Microtetraspora sp. AC03309 TaxID=2779376 RepID=UPI0007740838|nr:hypothetical protein [Microtetraspora sp. AC03309]MCC5576519.1 DUF3817 domain-containing protein [Microtetraspora sp. AC03309]
MNRTRQPLRIAAAVELASLLVLLGNLATAHLPAISSLAGPIHGCAYLFTVIATARDPQRTPVAVGLALLPAVGGLLALRRLTTTTERAGRSLAD